MDEVLAEIIQLYIYIQVFNQSCIKGFLVARDFCFWTALAAMSVLKKKLWMFLADSSGVSSSPGVYSIQVDPDNSLLKLIYTTIGIDECSLGVEITSITAKPYILQKICFQRLCSKFLVFWHGHGYFWPLRSWSLLEAKNTPLRPKMAWRSWYIEKKYIIKVAQLPQKPLGGSNQIWATTSG